MTYPAAGRYPGNGIKDKKKLLLWMAGVAYPDIPFQK